jgi:predicted nuclease with TOPRIM domain
MILDSIREFFSSRRVAELEGELDAANQHVRIVRDQLEQEHASRQRMMDENLELRARISEVEPRLATALEREATAVKAVADFMAQQMFGRSIWGVGLPLPEKKEELEPLRRRPHVSEVQADDLRKFYEHEMYERAPVAGE